MGETSWKMETEVKDSEKRQNGADPIPRSPKSRRKSNRVSSQTACNGKGRLRWEAVGGNLGPGRHTLFLNDLRESLLNGYPLLEGPVLCSIGMSA